MSFASLSLDLASLRSAYGSGVLTPTALIDEIWRRLEADDNPAVWIHRLPRATLLDYARRLEGRSPDSLPLYGVPFAIKDNIDLAGTPTTAACPGFAYSPEVSAAVVQRLFDAGAIPIGKTNLDQFATGLVGVRSPYGVPRNPFRSDTIPGGSSSGSAVATAAGLVSFALGTDTAGSGRVPAGLNNLVGLKPTRGALSTRGVVPACRSLDCVSVFALTCADAAAVLAVAEAFDREDSFSRPRSVVSVLRTPLRVGIPADADLDFAGDATAQQLFAGAREAVAALGGEVVAIDFAPFRETAALLYQGPWVAERWAAIREFHARDAAAILPVTRQIIEAAREMSATDAFEGFYRLAALQRRAAAEWENMDVLLVPTAPRPYTVAEVTADPIRLNSRLGTYTNFVNLLDLSALAVPAGMRPDGLPWGVTLIAPAWHEPALLAFGSRWHARVGGRLGATPAPLPADSLVPATRPSPAAPATGIRLAVVGAHLSGLPLNHQLTSRHARLAWSGVTAPIYRLYALPDTTPPKPGMLRVDSDGVAIAVEVWEMDAAAFGTFVAAIPPPLCIGNVALGSGETVKGFLCEPAALAGAEDVSAFGGWRRYLESRNSAPGRGAQSGPDAPGRSPLATGALAP